MHHPSGDIIFLAGDNGARFPDGNCIFIDDEIPTVIDPATRKEDLERIECDHRVRLVINTHYHVDHTRYTGIFSGAELAAHPLDAPAIESIDGMAKMIGVDEVPWFPIWKHVMQGRWGFKGHQVTRPVNDGEEINVGANTLRFYHLPGHTPGNLAVHFLEKDSVYLADIDMSAWGPWYGNRLSDIDVFLDSIERVKNIIAGTWYTAHREGVIQGDIKERLDAFASVVDARDRRILDFLASPRNTEEIIDAILIYGKRWEPPEMFDFFEGMMVGKHLARLERAAKVRQDGGRWRLA